MPLAIAASESGAQPETFKFSLRTDELEVPICQSLALRRWICSNLNPKDTGTGTASDSRSDPQARPEAQAASTGASLTLSATGSASSNQAGSASAEALKAFDASSM